MGPASLLSSLFETVLICDSTGLVKETFGKPLEIEHILIDPRLRPIYPKLERCLSGDPFETWFTLEARERTRWRGIPVEGGVCIAIEPPAPISSFSRRLKIGESEYEFIVENMRQGLWRLDSAGLIVFANAYLAHWLETTIEGMIGLHWSVFMKSRDETERFEAELTTTSGLRRRAIVTSAAIHDTDGSRGMVELITDITAEHALQTKLVEEVQRMSRLARTDALTGLANRLEFDHALKRLESEGNKEPFAVVMVDVDSFKEVNDRFGHEAGDRVLVEFSLRLKSAVRETDLVARYGGDEFVLLLPRATRQRAEEIVSRLHSRLSFDFLWEEHSIPTTASIGWSHSEEGPSTSTRADKRMYREKRRRKRTTSGPS